MNSAVPSLRGERAEDADREYQPGQYIRTQREARDARRSNEEERGRIRVLKMAAGAVLVLCFHLPALPEAGRCVPARADRTRDRNAAGRGGSSIPMRLLGSFPTITRVNGRQDQIITRGRCQPDRRGRGRQPARLGGEGDDGERHRRRGDFGEGQLPRRRQRT